MTSIVHTQLRPGIEAILKTLKRELQAELSRILKYWMSFGPDDLYGGFKARLDNNNIPDENAPKGLVLHARILWTFSAAYNATKDKAYLAMAARACQYLREHFTDLEHGGYYWSLSKNGEVLDDKKQIYGIAFCLYGLAEYYNATRQAEVLDAAKSCYAIIDRYSFDPLNGGYFEAFTRDWQPIADLRLSERDANEKKTMNTHLHVLEAYANLFRVWPDEGLKRKMELLLENFNDHIIDPGTGHLRLFFKEDWTVQSSLISYGHDIEAAWLLLEAAELTTDDETIKRTKAMSARLVRAAKEGLDTRGGLWYENEHGVMVYEKHWWPQAEAIVGFFNAWQQTGEVVYLETVVDTWIFIKEVLIDKENGEWFWGCTADHAIMKGEDKVGFWKCPYHNTRACLELIRRIDSVLN